MEPFYREHIGTLETVLYNIEVVFNSEVIYSGTSLLEPWKLSFI